MSSVLTGDVPLSLGTSENLSFAARVEYRDERGVETPTVLRQKNISRLLQLQPTGGQYDVTELFGELQVPVVYRLTVDMVARVGDYSSVGRTGSWRVGLNAPFSDALRLRATLATAVGAPNIRDLFAGAVNNVTLLFDPCSGVNASTTGNVAETCRSIPAIQRRIADTGAFTLTQVETQQTSSFTKRSPTVQEEEAESYTLGFVLTPRWMERLSSR